MQSFVDQAKIYGQYHTKPITRYTHFIGVPMIVFSIMIVFSFLQLTVPGVFSRTTAELLTLWLILYYIVLNWRLGLTITPVLILLLWLADWVGGEGPTSTALEIFAIFFIAGWAIQLIGHIFEGKRPAFTTNLWQAVIAPLFLTAEVYFMFGKMQDLKQSIYGEPSEAEST
jgi:uncharacterized membrane protein YGL010W